MWKHLTATLLWTCCAFAVDQWTPALSMKLQNVGDVIPSPDGRLVAWTQTRMVMEPEKSEQLTHIFLASADGTHRRQLTRGDKTANSPAFTPDGSSLLFLSDRAGKRNLYRIPVDGGEAEMVTDWKGAISSYRTSPDGKRVAFLGLADNPDDEKRRKEKRDFRVVDENPRNQSLYVITLNENGKAEPKKLFEAAYHVGQFDWAPDGSRIAFEHRPTPDADIARRADLAEVEVSSGKVTELATTESAEAQPFYSPDGRFLAFVRSQGIANSFNPNRIVLMTRQTGTIRELPATGEDSPNVVGWSPDSKRLYFVEAKGTRGALYAMPVDGPPQVVLAPTRQSLGANLRLNTAGNTAGIVLQSSTEPAEAYVLRLGGQPVRVSQANPEMPSAPLGKTELVRWKAADGVETEGLLTYPVNYESGKKVPLILVIHGGPSGVFTENFIGAPGLYPIATFAAKGYAVLRCNIRGSVGYGREFRGRNKNDWGGGDYKDLMAGVDYVIKQGVADPDRLAVMGWSYGGYMTAWVVSQTTRFKAAAVGAGLTNLVSMWGTNDIPSVLDDYFTGSPWQNHDLYWQRSALAHIQNVKTPTLFLHGEADNRVPIGQAFEMYASLKRIGVKTKMVTYPRTPHGPQEPKFMQDIMERHLAWVEENVR